ncbi:hypothetical protein ACFYOY_49120, partial [Streptomyces sp. NPDC007875]
GWAYRYPLSPSTGWWDRLTTPVDDELRRADGRRTFGLMELAVRAPWRRLGVAPPDARRPRTGRGDLSTRLPPRPGHDQSRFD